MFQLALATCKVSALSPVSLSGPGNVFFIKEKTCRALWHGPKSSRSNSDDDNNVHDNRQIMTLSSPVTLALTIVLKMWDLGFSGALGNARSASGWSLWSLSS